MATKEHHFVPQFYLRRFASDATDRGRRISLCRLSNGSVIHGASIKNQCRRSWFYGKDPTIERALSDLEDQAAPLLTRLCRDRVPPNPRSADHLLLLGFAALQGLRTDRVLSEALVAQAKLLEVAFGDERAATDYFGEPASPISIDVHLRNVELVAKSYEDLDIVLLRTPGRQAFITSDHPLALYNQYAEQCSYEWGTTGAAARGLQAFLPLTPSLAIMLYDAGVYRCRQRRAGAIPLSERDVSQINLLQAINAGSLVYFPEQIEHRIPIQAVMRAAPFRPAVGPRVTEAIGVSDPDRALVHSFRATANIGLGLSFLTLYPAARLTEPSLRMNQYRPWPYEILRRIGPRNTRRTIPGTFEVTRRV